MYQNPQPAVSLLPPSVDWMGRDATLTRLFEALSVLAPEAERLFINAVRDHTDQLDDDHLRHACSQFIREEGQHSMTHRAFNQRLQMRSYFKSPVGTGTRLLFAIAAKLPAAWRLALTCAGEHLSAAMAALYLRDELHRAIEDADTRDLYRQHAVEEWGHRTVAFDVMRAHQKINYPMRIAAFAAISIAVPFCLYETCVRLSPRMLWAFPLLGLKTLIRPSSHNALRRFAGYYLGYLKPGFHPAKRDRI